MPRSGVLVDIDGTLVDSNYLHTLAFTRAFVEAGYTAFKSADIHRAVGMGAEMVPAQVLGHDAPEVTEIRKRHWKALRDEVRPLPGAAAFLSALHERGLAVVLATSSDPDDVGTLLDALGADPASIDHITTAGDVPVAKPHPAVFEAAMAAGHLDPVRSIAIGDTVWDVRAAARAGLACIAVESGGIGRGELLDAGAASVYPDVATLLAGLDASPIGQLRCT